MSIRVSKSHGHKCRENNQMLAHDRSDHVTQGQNKPDADERGHLAELTVDCGSWRRGVQGIHRIHAHLFEILSLLDGRRRVRCFVCATFRMRTSPQPRATRRCEDAPVAATSK